MMLVSGGGKSLAKSYPVEADLVTGVPESGIPAAKGYSEESGIPFGFAFYKNSYIGRTFIKPTQKERESSVHLKLSVLILRSKANESFWWMIPLSVEQRLQTLSVCLKKQAHWRYMYESVLRRSCIHAILEQMYHLMIS